MLFLQFRLLLKSTSSSTSLSTSIVECLFLIVNIVMLLLVMPVRWRKSTFDQIHRSLLNWEYILIYQLS